MGRPPASNGAAPTPTWSGTAEVGRALAAVGYLSDPLIDQVVFLARALGKPVLIEGPSGVGKTSLARSVARALDARFVRLQCYEGLTESRALYDWNYRKQLLAVASSAPIAGGSDTDSGRDVFGEEFLVTRPLLAAISAVDETVLLIDEVDRIEMQTEALLLEVLSEHQITIPELGTIVATRRPLVFLTSNAGRELSEALRRRCLSLYMAYPDAEREQAIILHALPGIRAELAADIAAFAARARAHRRVAAGPSVTDVLSWANTLVRLSADVLDEQTVHSTLELLLVGSDTR